MEVYPEIVRVFQNEPAVTDLARARQALALQLALKLDEAVADTSTGSAQATPGISKELRSVLEDISMAQGKKAEFVASIFDDF